MKILIKYSSLSGNTEKIAKFLFENIKDKNINIDIMKIHEEINLENYDLIIVGTWIRRATADPKAQKFIKELKNKKVAFFFTLGAYPNTDYANIRCENNIRNLFLENNNEILGSFHCHGAISCDLQERIKIKTLPYSIDKEKLKRWKDASTHPDMNDLEDALIYFMDLLKRFD